MKLNFTINMKFHLLSSPIVSKVCIQRERETETESKKCSSIKSIENII
jgi:hypothetical protein